MKVDWNRKQTTTAVYTLIVIALAALFVVFLLRFNEVSEFFSWVMSIAAPIIIGIAVAYILNPLMMWIEKKFFGRLINGKPKDKNAVIRKLEKSSVADSAVVKKIEEHAASVEKKKSRRAKLARVFAIILTVIFFFVFIGALFVAVIPNVAKSVVDLAENLPGYLKEAEEFLDDFFKDNPAIGDFLFDGFTNISDALSKLAENLKPMAGDVIGDVGSGVVSFLMGVLEGVKNFLVGFIIAIYLLYSKERLLAQIKKLVYAVSKTKRCEKFFYVAKRTNDIFKRYIVSALLDAMFIFAAMAIGTLAMGMPYALLIAAICGVTNLIPFFGPFIGAIPSGLLILFADPSKVIWFALFVLILQQVDGNIVMPHIYGETIGLPPIWVLISITIGGGLFGIAGMLLSVPAFAVIYTLSSELVASRLRKKNMPENTEDYTRSTDELSLLHAKTVPPDDVRPSEETVIIKEMIVEKAAEEHFSDIIHEEIKEIAAHEPKAPETGEIAEIPEKPEETPPKAPERRPVMKTKQYPQKKRKK